MTKKQGKPEGYLIRGVDGRLYYISDTNLQQYAIQPKHHKAVANARRKAKALQEIGVATSDSVRYCK